MMVHNAMGSNYRLFKGIGALISLGLALYLPSAFVSLVSMVQLVLRIFLKHFLLH